MSHNSVKTNIIEIKKGDGITHALKRYVEQNPNSVISDNKITLAEWNATIDKLVEINNQRIKDGKKSIFTGRSERNDYRRSFVVHASQKIEFTETEINQLFETMGVTIHKKTQDKPKLSPAPDKNNNKTTVSPTKKKNNIPVVPTDSIKKTTPSGKTEANDNAAKTIKTNIPAQVKKTATPAKTENKSRFSLSWKEIGKQALKSGKNFVKSMFCDEKGFSLKRTATTIGVIAGLALAAPAAAAFGASTAVVSGIALGTKIIGAGLGAMLLYSGSKKTIEGTKEYLGAENRKQAEAGMEKAMDGAVELASIPIIGGLVKTGSKLVNMVFRGKSAKPQAQSQPEAQPQPQSQLQPETKPSSQENPISEPAPQQPVVENTAASAQPVSKPAPAEPKAEVKPQPKPQSENKTVTQQTPNPKQSKPGIQFGPSKTEKPRKDDGFTFDYSKQVEEPKPTKTRSQTEPQPQTRPEPRGMNVTPREFAPHSYTEADIPQIRLNTRTYESDYRMFEISEGGFKRAPRDGFGYKTMANNHREGSIVQLIIGKNPNGQKFVAFEIPSGRFDKCGRSCRAMYELTSEPGKDFTPVQIDAIKTIMNLTPEQMLAEYPLSRGTTVLDRWGGNNDISISLDVILREIAHFSKGKELPSNIVKQIKSVDALQPGKHIELLQYD